MRIPEGEERDPCKCSRDASVGVLVIADCILGLRIAFWALVGVRFELLFVEGFSIYELSG